MSAKGYGAGFVSTAPRFKDLKTLQQAFLPGPGSYTTQAEGPPEGGKLTSFSSLKRVRCSCHVGKNRHTVEHVGTVLQSTCIRGVCKKAF